MINIGTYDARVRANATLKSKLLVVGLVASVACISQPGASRANIPPEAIAAAGPVVEKVLDGLPKAMKKIGKTFKGLRNKRKARRHSYFKAIEVIPMDHHTLMAHGLIKCGEKNRWRKRYVRGSMKVFYDNRELRIVSEPRPNGGYQRELRDTVQVRNFIPKEHLRAAIKAEMTEFPVYLKFQAKCEVRHKGKWKGHTHSPWKEVRMVINLRDAVKEYRAALKKKASSKAQRTKPKNHIGKNSIKIVRFKPKTKRIKQVCPAKIAFDAQISASRKLNGKTFVTLNRKKGRVHNWAMKKKGKATSTIVQTFKGKRGKRFKSVVARLHVKWKNKRGKVFTAKSKPVKLQITCVKPRGGFVASN